VDLLRSRRGGFHHFDFGDGWFRSNLGRCCGRRFFRRSLSGSDRGHWRRRSNNLCDLLVSESGGTLEAPAKLAKAFGAAGIAAVAMNLFELSSKFGGAAVVASPQHKVEQLFEG
jgi:hypothetical protein